jgi:hypothetical protein
MFVRLHEFFGSREGKEMASAAAAGGSSAAPAKAGGEELHIAAGTYTHFIQGLSVNTAAGTAKPAYSYEAHAGPVMAIAAAGSHLVSGSYDEMIKWARWEERTEDGKRRKGGKGGARGWCFSLCRSLLVLTWRAPALDGISQGVQHPGSGGGWHADAARRHHHGAGVSQHQPPHFRRRGRHHLRLGHAVLESPLHHAGPQVKEKTRKGKIKLKINEIIRWWLMFFFFGCVEGGASTP